MNNSIEIVKEKESKAKNPRVNTKKLLLTYSQCYIDIKSCFSSLDVILRTHNRNIVEYVLSTEKHQDGSSHIHAYIELDNRIDTRNMRLFDISQEGKVYHPNILKSKYKAACIEYILKDVTDLNSSSFIASKGLKNLLTIHENKIKFLPYQKAVRVFLRCQIFLNQDGCRSWHF